MAIKENIIIEFTPKGDRAMVQAIKALDKATQGLLKTQATIWDTTKKTTKEITKYERSLKKTTKAQKNQSNATMLGVRNLRNMSKAAGGAGSAFSVLRSKLLLFNFAMAMGTRQILKFAEEATKIENMGRAFDTLSGGTMNASISMNKLREATDGTMSNFDLLQQANNAMILGVSKNSDEMAEMFDMAQRLGAALGKDTRMSVESLITGIGRQSRLMLDNIGIMVKVGEAAKAYASELDKTVDQLTDAERKQAFLNATIDAARTKLKGIGDEVASNAYTMQQFQASVVNLQSEIGKAFLPLILSTAEGLTEFMDALDADNIQRWATAIGIGTAAFVGLKIAVRLAKIETWSFTAALAKNPIGIFAVVVSLAAGALLELFGAFEDGEPVVEANRKELEKQKEVLEGLTEEQKKGEKSLQQRLDLLNATNEFQKEFIRLGHDASMTESILINKIVARNKELKEEKENLKAVAAEAKRYQELLDAQLAIRDKLLVKELEISGASEEDIKAMKLRVQLISDLSEVTEGYYVDNKFVNQSIRDLILSGAELTEGFSINTAMTTKNQGAIDALNDAIKSLVTIFNLEMAATGEKTDLQKEIERAIRDTIEAQKDSLKLLIKEMEAQVAAGTATKYHAEAIKNLKEELESLGETTSRIPEWVEGATEVLTTLQIGFDAFSQTAQMYFANQQAGWDKEVQNLKNSDKYKRASTRQREVWDKELADKQRSAKETAWKQQRALNMSQVVMDTASAIMSIWAQVPKFDFGISAGVLSGFVTAMGAAQLGIIASQTMPEFQRGGLIGGKRHAQGGTVIEAEQGEYILNREAVHKIGLTNLEKINNLVGTLSNMNWGGWNTSNLETIYAVRDGREAGLFEKGGLIGRPSMNISNLSSETRPSAAAPTQITVNFSGNVLSDDFIVDEAIPKIKEAIRRGADIGIS